jgi:hypothetical protein
MMRHRFLQIVLAMGVCGAPAALAQPLHMPGAEITATFSGGAFDGVYADNSPWKETYNADGSIVYSDRFGPRTGQWSVRGAGDFCTYYTDGSGACWRVERVSENCFRFYVALGDPTTDRAASATGWDTARPSTCGPGKPVS